MTRSIGLLLSSLLLSACVGGGRSAEPGALAPDAAASPDAPPAPPAGSAEPGALFQLIDDMESAKSDFAAAVGLCSWYTRAGTAAEEEVAPPRNGSRRAWHARAADPAGVDLRIDFHGPQFPRVPYPDFSAYAGVAFWARAGRQGDAITVAVEDDRVAGQPGYQEARRSARPWPERAVNLSSGWRRTILLFDDFRATAPLHTAAIWSVHFLAAAGDFWIDDLALLCRGECPAPPWDTGKPTASGLDERSLSWLPGQGSTPDLQCAQVASLGTSPLVDVAAGPDERLFLRARIPVEPRPAVPLWAWLAENLGTGQRVPVTTLDDQTATAVIPIVTPGPYRIRTHTHYPGLATCGVEVTFQAVAPTAPPAAGAGAVSRR
jgi:hypothetical protein